MNLSLSALRWVGAALALTLAGCATTFSDEVATDPRAAEIQAASRQLKVEAPTLRTTQTPLFLAHYMPWYSAPPVSKGYGWHWHMGFYDPFAVVDGQRPIATHYYPLIGPYDSSDPRVIEYQLLTMKAAGIEGVIIDWYGIDAAFDYPEIHKASQVLFAAVKKAGMTFAVCYEDQSVAKLVAAKAFTEGEAVARTAATFRWLDQNWFRDPAYLKRDGRPVVLNFGPQKFTLWSDWEKIFATAAVRPWSVSLEDHAEHDADGFYNWPAMARSGGGTLRPDVLVDQLNTFYAKTRKAPWLVASAWPGFHDIYQQAGVAASYGFLDDYDGETFRLTLGAALKAKADVVQLATWNDYGEGTVLEPNKVRGYGPLEDLQAVRRQADSGFAFAGRDLRLPLQLFQKRQEPGVDQAKLDQVAAALFAGNPALARDLLGALPPVPMSANVTPTTTTADATPSAPLGKNLAFGKAARSNNHADVYTADKTTDGETLTYWEGAAKAYPNDLWVDLRSPQVITKIVLKLNPRRIWGARTQTLEVWAGASLETLSSVVGSQAYVFDPASGGNAITIAVAGTYQVIQVRFTANTEAGGGQVAEFEVYGE